MYCMNCGKENPDGVKFCCFCGKQAITVPRSIEEITDKISENLAENGQLDFEDTADITSSLSEKSGEISSVISEVLSEKTVEKPVDNVADNAPRNAAEKAPENTAVKPVAPQIPVPPVVPTAPASSTKPVSRVAPSDLVSNVSPVRNPMPSSPYGYPRNPYAYPQPQPINTNGSSPAPRVAQNTPNMNVPIKNTAPEEKQGVGRTFTLKHIIMCLVSTAVCAIAAGVFAGLYFSVI